MPPPAATPARRFTGMPSSPSPTLLVASLDVTVTDVLNIIGVVEIDGVDSVLFLHTLLPRISHCPEFGLNIILPHDPLE